MPSRPSSRNRRSRIASALAAASLALLAGAPGAPAEGEGDGVPEPYGATDKFAPQAAVAADTTQAGAHPDLTLVMTKTPNQCPQPGFPGLGSCGYFKPAPPPFFAFWSKVPLHLEQDLKRWIVRFPEGLMADPQAAPKCDSPQKGGPQTNFQYQCPPASQVGTLTGKTRNCTPAYCSNEEGVKIGGAIYNGTPGPGEQGHLYTLLGAMNAAGKFSQWIRVDTSVRVDPQTFRIVATTDNIPDFVDMNGQGALLPVQPYDLTMKLWGKTGAAQGHPLLTNATFCEPRSLDSELQGYANFAHSDDGGQVHTGVGEGKTVTASSEYKVTGCDAVPYEPKLSMALSDSAPGAAPALDTSIEQADGEQTTRSATVRIPGAFKINAQTKVAPCKIDQLAAGACPPAAEVGTSEAASRLLPSGPLSGKVIMGEASGSSFPLQATLTGFVNVTIAGKVGIEPSGDLLATFENLPPVPISSFRMHLDGGTDRGLLINPARCGTSEASATFTSHAGREVARAVPLRISCGGVTFDARLGKLRKGRAPKLTLGAHATGLDRLAFQLPGELAPARAGLGKTRAVGSISFKLAKGLARAKLRLGARSKRRLELSAQEGGKTVASLSLNGSRRALRKRGSRGKRVARQRSGSLELVIDQLPTGTVAVDLELGGGRSKFLGRPSRCNRNLSFGMKATDPDGAQHVATRRVRVRCARPATKRRGRRDKRTKH